MMIAKSLLSIVVIVLFSTSLYASPKLNFSDLVSGPASGLNDGLGSGAIVTVWGNDLGASIGTSTITIGGQQPAHIYYWKNADGNLPGGPSNLYKYHKMQEICFSVPSMENGDYDITVTVNGKISNPLPFTIRDGNIFFVDTTGDDLNDGSFLHPWRDLTTVFSGDGRLLPGDIVYTKTGSDIGINVGSSAKIAGTALSPISLIAYPGNQVQVSGASYDNKIIYNYYYTDDTLASEYLIFSKLKILAFENDTIVSTTAITGFFGMRVIGVEITGPTAYSGYQGAIGGNHKAASGGTIYGVYIHDYGRANGISTLDNTSTSPPYNSESEKNSWDAFQHVFYLSNRTENIYPGYTIGYCLLENNPMWQGIHVYDQDSPGGWSSPIYIHDNIIINQRGGGIEVDLPDATVDADIIIYNNIITSTVDDVYSTRAIQVITNTNNVFIYNNTFSGWNQSNRIEAAYSTVINNIFDDVKEVGLTSSNEFDDHKNNLWNGTSIIDWQNNETGSVMSSPMFINQASNDFHLQSTSPARNAGTTISIVDHDFDGLTRPQGAAYDIGAYEYTEVAEATAFNCGAVPIMQVH